jgi:hypothetical protein
VRGLHPLEVPRRASVAGVAAGVTSATVHTSVILYLLFYISSRKYEMCY